MNLENIKKYSYYLVVGLILLFGFLIRLKLLLDNPSFWFDESCLGFNVLSLNYAEFFKPLHLQQIAPPLFLVMSKLNIDIFGASDMNLRLFPFIIGNLAMLMFLLVLKQNFKNKLTIILGLFFLCFNVQAMKYSVEFKPYIVEMFSTCLVLYVFTKLNWNYSYKKLALIGFGLALVPWFAFISAVMISIAFLLKFSKEFYKKWIVFISPFLISSGLLIFYYLKIKNFYNEFMVDFFTDSFFNFHDFLIQFSVVINSLFQMKLVLFPIILLLLAIIYCLIKKEHKFLLKFSCLVMLSGVILSFLQIYLFYGRFVVFILPLVLLLITSLFNGMIEHKKFYTLIPTVVVLIFFMIPMVFIACNIVKEPFNKESCARELFIEMAEKQKVDDVIIIDTLSLPDFLYYNGYYNLKNRLYWNGLQKGKTILYKMDKDEQIPLEREHNNWLFATWPSTDYSYLTPDYEQGCKYNSGLIMYFKKDK